MKEKFIPLSESEVTAAIVYAQSFIGLAGLNLPVIPDVTKKGTLCMSINSRKVDPESVRAIARQDLVILLKHLARNFSPEPPGNFSTPKLLTKPEFANSCLSELPVVVQGNSLLNSISDLSSETIPVLYGSTSGLNLAELWETQICAIAFQEQEIPAAVVFDSHGHESPRANQIFNDSSEVLPESLREELLSEKGDLCERRVAAAHQLALVGVSTTFLSAESLFLALDRSFTLGKLALLASLVGNNQPLAEKSLFELTQLGPNKQVSAFISQMSGFTSYAREAVIGAEFPGAMAIPLKLTTHANIYDLLGRYGALYAQRAPHGVILCPIQRHRIQTREQSLGGSDPCDVLVLALLAREFPDGFTKLVSDFTSSCRVLTPPDAVALGTKDKKFIIEDYFPI